MKIFNFFKKLLNKNVEVITKPEKTFKDLQIFDTVWIKENGIIYKGWVFEISRRCITVVYGNDLKDYKFQIPKPLNVVKVEQDNKILYCNER